MARRYRGVLSMEDNGTNPPAEGATDDLGLNAIGEEIADHVEEQAKMETDQAEVETAEAATDGIAELQEMATEAWRQGGLNAQAAYILSRSVTLLAEVGKLPTQDRMANISVENFANSATRRKQTEYTIEGITDVLKDAWAAIVRWWGQFTDWVAETWNKYFGAYENLKKAAEALAKKAADKASAKNDDPSAKIENASLAKALSTGTAVQADIHTKGPEALKVLTDAISHASKHIDSGGICEELIKVLGGNDEEKAKLTVPTPGDFAKSKEESEYQKFGLDKPKDGMKIYATPALPGNVVWYARIPAAAIDLSMEADTTAGTQTTEPAATPEAGAAGTDDKKSKPLSEKAREALKQLSSCNAGIITSDKDLKTDNIKAEIAVLTPSNIEDMAKKVADACGTLISFRSRADKRNKVAKQFKEQVTKLANRAKSANSDEVASLDAKKTVASAGGNLVDFGSTKTATQIMQLAKALLHLGSLSLAKYK